MLRAMFGLWVARAIALTAALSLLLRDRLPLGVAIAVSLVAALLLNVAITLLLTARKASRDAKLLDRAARGQLPRDGERMAMIGTIRIDGEPLRAPFSDAECAMYSYGISHQEYLTRDTTDLRRPTRTVIDFSGLALAPMKIETSNGRFRLLSFPFVDGFPAGRRESPAELANAAAYLRKTKFEKLSALGRAVGAIGAFDDAVSQSDGAFRRDWEGAGRRDVHELTLDEVWVPIDVPAVAIGVYDEKKGGLRSASGASELRLLSGDARQVRERLSRGAGKTKAIMLFAPVAAVVALLYFAPAWFLSHVPGGGAVLQAQAQRLADALRDDDVATVQRLARAVDPNAPIDGDVLPLMMVRSAAAARALLDAGADPNGHRSQERSVLMELVPSAPADVIRLVIERGADIHEMNPVWNQTPLMLAREHGNNAAAEVLIAAGAKR